MLAAESLEAKATTLPGQGEATGASGKGVTEMRSPWNTARRRGRCGHGGIRKLASRIPKLKFGNWTVAFGNWTVAFGNSKVAFGNSKVAFGNYRPCIQKLVVVFRNQKMIVGNWELYSGTIIRKLEPWNWETVKIQSQDTDVKFPPSAELFNVDFS